MANLAALDAQGLTQPLPSNQCVRRLLPRPKRAGPLRYSVPRSPGGARCTGCLGAGAWQWLGFDGDVGGQREGE